MRQTANRKHIMIKTPVWKILATLTLLPLMACGQTPENNSASPAAANIDTKLTQNLTQKLEKTYQGQKIKVLSVRTTPINGLYEVLVTGNQLVYVDAEANYMLVGDLLDVNTRRSLTEERLAEINKVDYAKLPFDNAIKEIRGSGKLHVVVFSDPDCPYCKRLEHEFARMTDVTVHTFLMPIPSLHPQAKNKAEQIWCQSDRTDAWINWMRANKTPPTAPACANPVADNMALGERFGFNGTPTMVFPNGKTLAGYLPQDELEKTLNQNQ